MDGGELPVLKIIERRNKIGGNMKKTLVWFPGLLPLFLYIFILNGCASLISPFNQTAYEYATSLKVEALALMDKATEPYTNHQEEV